MALDFSGNLILARFSENKVLKNSVPLLRFYDTSLPTLQVDASKSGLGACLVQQGQPVAFASRAL